MCAYRGTEAQYRRQTRRKGGADKKEVDVGIGCRTNLSGLAHQSQSAWTLFEMDWINTSPATVC